MDIFKRHPLAFAIIVFLLVTLPDIIDTYLGLYETVTGVSMPPLNLGFWIWLLPLIGAILAVLVYWRLHQAKLLDDIKKDLVNMNVIERNTATKIASQINLPPTTVLQIGKDHERLAGDFLGTVINIILDKDYHALVEHFNTVGQIPDMHKVGLKSALIDNEEYTAAKLDLEQKRLRLKPKRRYRFTQANIVSVEQLSYGLNSQIVLRGILANTPEYIDEIPAETRHELEAAENTSETILKIMLDDLQGDWTKEKKK